MKKLNKTRKLLTELIEKDRKLQIGTPFTDTDIKEVSKELNLFEKNYSSYKLWSILTVFIWLLIFLFFIYA